MKNFAIILCFSYISVIALYSQDVNVKPPNNWTSYINLESGILYPAGTIKESLSIRQNISNYYVNQITDGQISAETAGYTVGLRWEIFNSKFKTGISTGLRFTGYNSLITGFSSNNSDFFYLRYSMENSDTKFARVKSLVETNNYLSIPLELRFVPIQIKGVRFFARAGTELNFITLKKLTDIKFQEASMESQQDNVLKSIGITSGRLYSTLYGSIGIRIGHENKPGYMFELFLPSFFLTKDNFALTEAEYFNGFRFSVEFPVKKHN